MVTKKKKTRKSRKLVLGYLERISSTLFSDFPQELTNLVKNKHGVYALYKGDRLYYLGLATNLRNRIKHHLKDKHQGKWNRFSLYLVRKVDHIKEIESVLLRIADPKGNVIKGRLPEAENLKKELHSKIMKAHKKQIAIILGSKKKGEKPVQRKKLRRDKQNSRPPVLTQYINTRFEIRATRKGKEYKAKVRSNGTINFDGKIFPSPSIAGKHAYGRITNGWFFWKYKNKNGDWVWLDELRKR